VACVALLVACTAHASGNPKEPGVEIVSIRPKYGFLLDENGRMAEDVRVRYRIVGPRKGVREVWLELRDAATDALYFRTTVPAARGGAIVCPRGTQLRNSARDLGLSVANTNGRRTAVVLIEGVGGRYASAAEITDVSPSAVRVGDPAQTVRLRGTGFTPESAVVVARLNRPKNDYDVLGYAPVRFLTPQEVQIDAEPGWFAEAGELHLGLRSEMPRARPPKVTNLRVSGRFGRLVVSRTDAPILRRIEPAMVADGDNWFWLTLRGAQFTPTCSVFVSASGHPLTTRYLSAGEMQAQLPGGLVAPDRPLGVRMECGGPHLVSAEHVLHMVGGPPAAPRRPTLEEVLPAQLRPLLPHGPGTAAMRIFGSGFEPGAVVHAHVDKQAPVALATEWVSAHELRATIAREQWGTNHTNIRVGLTGGDAGK
jgi:hypothetical protein